MDAASFTREMPVITIKNVKEDQKVQSYSIMARSLEENEAILIEHHCAAS